MSKTKDGGPAYPTKAQTLSIPIVLRNKYPELIDDLSKFIKYTNTENSGMAKREVFAKAALIGLLSACTPNDEAVQESYQIADAMLAEGAKP